MYSTTSELSKRNANNTNDLWERDQVKREKTAEDIAAENKRKCAVTVRKFRNLSWLYERNSK